MLIVPPPFKHLVLCKVSARQQSNLPVMDPTIMKLLEEDEVLLLVLLIMGLVCNWNLSGLLRAMKREEFMIAFTG